MMEEQEILNVISEELTQSVGGSYSTDAISQDRESALATYLGQKNGKEVEGRSSVISTDVADAIEWIMPEIVKAFTQNNEVVTFDPCYEGDEKQAELESQYVYDVLMKDNNGFLVLHQFIKDALMQKNGFIKVFYEESDTSSSESYTGLDEQALTVLLSDPNVELTESSYDELSEGGLRDVKVSRKYDTSKVCVVCVPPEEFRVNRMHNSVDLDSSRFCAHVFLKSTSDLIKDGYDKELIDNLPYSDDSDEDSDYRFYLQGENTAGVGQTINHSAATRFIEVAECYALLDINGDGIAEYVKVTCAGGDNPHTILDIEEIEENPFISSTAILMSHKLMGLSIYDRLKQIQDQKTTLWRNILDNVYLQNNQRTIVVEGQVNLDDLMVSRPGGIIRASRTDSVIPLQTPSLSTDAYNMMQYLDQVRASRSGVTPEGPVTDSMIGDRVGSEGVDRMMSQREELVGLMIRVIAETGVKPLCNKIRTQVIRHQDVARDYMFRGQWVPVSPASWRNRPHTTVRVGTGTGNNKSMLASLTGIMAAQEKLGAQPGQTLVQDEQVFNVLHDFAKFSGLTGIRRYILDPASPEGQKAKQASSQQAQETQKAEQEQEQALTQAQMKVANAEESKARTAGMNAQLRAEIDSVKNQISAVEKKAQAEIAIYKQRFDETQSQMDSVAKNQELQFKYWEANKRAETELERARIQKEAKQQSKPSGGSDDS